MLSVCLVLVSLFLGVIGFLLYRRSRPAAAIADFPPPAYLNHYKGACELGWVEKPGGGDGDWAYLEPRCSCRDLYQLPEPIPEQRSRYLLQGGGTEQSELTDPGTILDIPSTFRRTKQGFGPDGYLSSQLNLDDWNGTDQGLELSRAPSLIDPTRADPSLIDPPDYFLPRTDNKSTQRGGHFSITDFPRGWGRGGEGTGRGRGGGREGKISRLNIENGYPNGGITALKYLNQGGTLNQDGTLNKNIFHFNQTYSVSQDSLNPTLGRFDLLQNGLSVVDRSRGFFSSSLDEDPNLCETLLCSRTLSKPDNNSRPNLPGHPCNQPANSSNFTKSKSRET